jgi:hypothetical protein
MIEKHHKDLIYLHLDEPGSPGGHPTLWRCRIGVVTSDDPAIWTHGKTKEEAFDKAMEDFDNLVAGVNMAREIARRRGLDAAVTPPFTEALVMGNPFGDAFPLSEEELKRLREDV